MIEAVILGCGIYSEYLNQFICRGYNKVITDFGGEMIEVIAYWDFFETGKKELSGLPVVTNDILREMIAFSEVGVILVPDEHYGGQNDYLTRFFDIGIALENVYIAKSLEQEYSTRESIADIFDPYYSCRKLPYLEFHIADHCNLKCANCEHYSGLVNEEIFTDFTKFSQDIRQLKKFIDEIGMIRILGGEPLLNPEIEDYLRLVSEVYPNAPICVVTNALHIKAMPDSFFETLNNCCEGSVIDISLYPVMKDSIDDVEKYLSGKNVRYSVSPMNNRFRKQQKLTASDDNEMHEKFAHCFQKGCVNLYAGKLAACFLPFTTKYFNAYFDRHLPEDGAIDLYEEGLTTEMIRKHLSVPFERCRYCMEPIEEEWHIIHNPSILEDWV